MTEHTYTTPSGTIHYWINAEAAHKAPQLIFLPGLTADHRLFDKQIEYFEGKYPVLVWDAPGHAASWPFELTFTLMDKVKNPDTGKMELRELEITENGVYDFE